jgi:hypothetical protein
MIDLKTSGIFNSDSATSPYPTHLAITTPPSSLSRGDWGLKRPLPLRSTARTSTPHIRIISIDAWERVTEFESATNHTLTLQKWQEMNLPLSTPGAPSNGFYLGSYKAKGMGVFEEDMNGSKVKKDSQRWKFKGPWLAGQTAIEFNEYIRNEIRRRKPEFLDFLREVKAREDTKIAQKDAEERMESAPTPIKPSDITDDKMRQYIRELRCDRMTLFKLIRHFFDLPPTSSKLAALQNYAQKNKEGFGPTVSTINYESFLSDSDSPYAVTGPPKTHPSAGLSYLRTDSKIYNHPVYGPQAQPPPILGRIVQPKNTIGATSAKVGIAGVVADAPPTLDHFRQRARSKLSHPGLNYIDPDKEGGSKIWLRPTSASIDPQGRIDIKVIEDTGSASDSKEGTTNGIRAIMKGPVHRPQPLAKPPRTALGGYGLEASDVLGYGTRAVQSNMGTGGSSTPSTTRLSVDKNSATDIYGKRMASEGSGFWK